MKPPRLIQSPRRLLALVISVIGANLLFAAPAQAELSIVASSSDRIGYGKSIVVGPGETVHDVVSFGGSIRLKEGATASGDVVAMGGSIVLEPGVSVEGDVTSFGGSVSLGPGVSVEGDAAALGGSVELAPGATLKGSRMGSSGIGRGPKGHPRAAGQGDQTSAAAASAGYHSSRWASLWGGFASTAARYLAVFVLGMLALIASPRRMDRMRRPLANRRGDGFPKLLLVGLLAQLALIPLILLLVITVVGILLLPVLLLAYLVVCLLGWTVVALSVGHRLSPRGKRTPVRELALGMLLLLGVGLLSQVPWLGLVASLVLWLATLVGTGAVLMTRFGQPLPSTDAELWPPPPSTSAEHASL